MNKANYLVCSENHPGKIIFASSIDKAATQFYEQAGIQKDAGVQVWVTPEGQTNLRHLKPARVIRVSPRGTND